MQSGPPREGENGLVHPIRPGAACRFALRRKATQAVHHWRSTVLFAYSWQVHSKFGSEGSTHVVE